MAPKMTRRTFRPHSRTTARCPRGAQQQRSGGNSNRSVSSSTRKTLRGRAALISRTCWRIRRFFLALGVRVEDIAAPLPGVAQAVQFPAEGVARERLAGAPRYLLLQ